MLSFGDLVFDLEARRVLGRDGERRLSPKAAQVLAALAETPGHTWTRSALLDRVWPDADVGEEVLTQAIAEVRRALGETSRSPRYLATVPKTGYRLIAPAQLLERGDDPPTAGFDVDVYAAYLDACELYDKGGRARTAGAVATFENVIRVAPGFALGHIGLAKALTFLRAYYGAPLDTLQRAWTHCETATKLAPNCAEAHAAQGLILALAGKSELSRAHFTRAIARGADDGETHYLLGRASFSDLGFHLAAPIFERAAQLRMEDYHSLVMAGKVRLAAGDHERARHAFARALPRAEARLTIDPDDFRARCAAVRCLLQLGLDRRAEPLMAEIATHPDPMSYHLACTYARANDDQRALDILEQVVDAGWRHPAWLERDPDLDGLRAQPRFMRIAAAVNRTC